MTDVGVVISLALVGGMVVSAVLVAFALRQVSQRSSRGVSRRLIKGRGNYSARVPASQVTWNPARTGMKGLLNGPGTANYEIRADGLVHLDFVRADGSARQFCGPLNLAPVPSSGGSRRLAVVVLGASPVCAVGGFVVAYFWSSGSREERLEYGLFAAFGGWLIGYVLVMIWRVTHAIRALGKSK